LIKSLREQVEKDFIVTKQRIRDVEQNLYHQDTLALLINLRCAVSSICGCMHLLENDLQVELEGL